MIKDILSISGQSGLFKLVSQTKNGVIVESLVDGKRMPAYATSRISALEDISIFTEDGGDLRLGDVFVAIFEKGLEVDSKSDNNSLKAKFKEVLPEYDKDRVYTSDIKKVFAWFNLLKSKDYINADTVSKYKNEQETENTDNGKE